MPPAVRAMVPKDAACLLVLVLDEAGRPIRGHVLDANPKELGPSFWKSRSSTGSNPD
jgi:hypothetical protein